MIPITAALLVSIPFAMFLVLSTSVEFKDMDGIPLNRELNGEVTLSRTKRQWGNCAPGCFPSCQSNFQCQRFFPQSFCRQSCCCPLTYVPVDLKTACDGGPAVGACTPTGLCGQGFMCNYRGLCCRCRSGNSSGPCINGFCPTGYSCNKFNFCCPVASGIVIGQCINGQCPERSTCGLGNLCYANIESG
ncbi:unnamed protein product [Dracunculus medinensis]|uniref:CC domain-containing protein n=1 Tax=Dracunculus medinensis TaxID=318479 RepID=A0A0N4UFM6_DRAME|nr:unnamed protein product [Dracunculus medinensis]